MLVITYSGGTRRNAGREARAVKVPTASGVKEFYGQCLSYCLKMLKKGHGLYESADGAWKFRYRWRACQNFGGATVPPKPPAIAIPDYMQLTNVTKYSSEHYAFPIGREYYFSF